MTKAKKSEIYLTNKYLFDVLRTKIKMGDLVWFTRVYRRSKTIVHGGMAKVQWVADPYIYGKGRGVYVGYKIVYNGHLLFGEEDVNVFAQQDPVWAIKIALNERSNPILVPVNSITVD